MDFISWPEFGLSILAVIAVFFAVTGLMMVVATELTEEGCWFLKGTVIPLILLVVAWALPVPWNQILAGLAVVGALAVPWLLVWERREECLRPILTGETMLLAGGLVLVGLIQIHYEYFVQ